MNKIFILIAISLYLSNISMLNAQKSIFNYIPIELPNNSHQWVHVLKDTMMKPNNPSGNIMLNEYSNLDGPHKVIIKNQDMILFYESIYYTTQGIYAEKINLGTGDSKALLIWDRRTNGNLRELPETAIIRPNGELEIITSRYPNTLFLPRLGVLSVDTSDFEILDHTYGSFTDTNSLYLYSNRSFINILALTIASEDSTIVNYQATSTRRDDDTTLYIKGLRAVQINNTGHILSDTTINYILRDTDDQIVRSWNSYFRKLIPHGDTLIHLHFEYFEGDSIFSKLFYFDQQLNKIASYDMSKIFDRHTIFREVQNVTKNNITLIAYNYTDDTIVIKNRIALVLDHHGNLKEKFDLLNEDGSNMVTPLITNLSGIDGTIVVSGEVDPYSLNIWKTDGDSHLQLLKSFEFDSGYFMRPRKIIELPDDKILLFVQYVRDTIYRDERGFFPYASAIILFNREDLNLTTGIERVLITKNKYFNCFPNPAMDQTELVFTTSFTGSIEVINNEGTIIKSIDVIDKKSININTKHWPVGTYFISALSSISTDGKYRAVKLLKQ